MNLIQQLKALNQIDFSKSPVHQMIRIVQEVLTEQGLCYDTVHQYCLTIVSQQKVVLPFPPADWEELTASDEFKEMSTLYANLIVNTRKGWAAIVTNPDAYVIANFPEFKFS